MKVNILEEIVSMFDNLPSLDREVCKIKDIYYDEDTLYVKVNGKEYRLELQDD
jgi:hypothetical protein